MRALEIAELINNFEPSYCDPSFGDSICVYCENPTVKHYEDCPWELMPKVVTALQAAEALTETWLEHADDPYLRFCMRRLVKALGGDE